ncbi:MAG TPA: UbiD family decarboxylase [Solirubrobacterales bacterium]|nr:UbiD family decarboxylase [Solirubrobacterales bacterium]
MATPVEDLRDELDRLDRAARLARVRAPLDPRFEIAALARRLDRGPAVLCENVVGHDIPVVACTQATRADIALSMGVSAAELGDHIGRALEHPLAPEPVADGPVKERIESVTDLARQLPILTHHEHDAGPYITSGVVFAEDPDAGVRNLSYHRIQVGRGADSRMCIVQRHLHRLVTAAERRDEALPIAVVLGLDGPTRLAAATTGSAIPFGYDELALAGALKGAPEPIVACETIPVRVPARAEIVIEGHVLPGVREREGPFAEFDGGYERSDGFVFRATTLSMRAAPIYQGLVSGAREQLNIMGLAYEPLLLAAIRGSVPGARAVHVTPGGLRKFHVVVSIAGAHPGDGKDAIVAAFAAHRDVKHVVVVDDDVDVFDLDAVETAIATRFQADRDLVVIAGGRGNDVDKSIGGDGRTARMGLDATAGAGDAPARAVIPGQATLDLAALLGDRGPGAGR